MTRKTALRSLVVFGAALLLASMASASVFTVVLNNGTAMETRYQPREASWDSNVVVFLSETGNRVALSKNDIAEVQVETETKGFGTVIDTTTIDLGILPNDLPTEEETAASRQGQPSALEEVLTRSYDQQQFVEPGEMGGGIPVFGVGSTGPAINVEPNSNPR